MTHLISYSFTFRNDPERVFSVNIPLEQLEGMDLTLENVRNVVEEDLGLIADLMEDDLQAYEGMIMAPHLYPKYLQRCDENIRLVTVEPSPETQPTQK